MRTILLVEDNPITRKLVRFTLGQKGFEVVEATDGRSAMRLVAEREPDLVLQDLVLPDVDGFELVGRLRAQTSGRNVPILAFSGFVTKLEEARISAVGFDDLIVKPIEPSRLVQIVQAHLPDVPGADEHFGRGKRILVADDDPLQGKLAAFRLERLGFETVLVTDGSQALAAARAQTPDLLLSDIMMPGLDGFRLCLEVRKDARLQELPVVLMTSSYIDEEDRQLARQAGATSFVLRTPNLGEIIDAIRGAFASSAPAPRPTVNHADVEREHTQRVIQQLERQVQMNAGISQRCSLLSAELSILSGISNALTRHEDFDAALDEVLAACFDAGGISTGVLYLFDGEDRVRARAFGMASAWSERTLTTFFGNVEGLRSGLDGVCVVIPSEDERLALARAALAGEGVSSALAVPLAYRDELLGALFIASKTEPLSEEDRLAFIIGVAGQIAQAVALLRTFAAKAASERAAQETATTLRAMMDSMSDGVIVADASHRVLYSNVAAAQLLGDVAEAQAATTAATRQFLPDRVTPFPHERLPLGRAIRGEHIEREELFVRQGATQSGAWLSVNAQPVVDATGRQLGGVAVFRDVTAARNAQEQLMVADRMASIGMLAAGLAHEINNPLAAVLGHLDLVCTDLEPLTRGLADGAPLLEVWEDIVEARAAAYRVSQITRDLKIFARTEEDRSGAVDVNMVLESSIRLAWNEIRHRARLVKEFTPELRVDANESRLGQVFLNLIVNAAQAIPDGRADENEVRIATKQDEVGRVIVDVRDTGTGIPPEILGEIFTPFVTTKPPGVGTGLGLAICRRILVGVGAEIEVSSDVGKGTVFRVTFPRSVGREVQPRVTSHAPLSATKVARILVIDDDLAVLHMVQRALSQEHDLVAVSVAAEALAKLTAGERFDLIICDLMMPHMTGMELHKSLLVLDREQAERVVFMTGGAFSQEARTFLGQVGNTVVEKPFEIARLRAVINERIR